MVQCDLQYQLCRSECVFIAEHQWEGDLSLPRFDLIMKTAVSLAIAQSSPIAGVFWCCAGCSLCLQARMHFVTCTPQRCAAGCGGPVALSIAYCIVSQLVTSDWQYDKRCFVYAHGRSTRLPDNAQRAQCPAGRACIPCPRPRVSPRATPQKGASLHWWLWFNTWVLCAGIESTLYATYEGSQRREHAPCLQCITTLPHGGFPII